LAIGGIESDRLEPFPVPDIEAVQQIIVFGVDPEQMADQLVLILSHPAALEALG
jgi:hypothetical protein